MAHTKAQKAVKGNRDSRSKRLGVKLFGGEVATTGNIIVRQKGSKFHSGLGTFMAKDYTIHAAIDGVVRFHKQRGKMFIVIDSPDIETNLTSAKKTPGTRKIAPKKTVAATA
jgi:large subunit ribosomal protein L27